MKKIILLLTVFFITQSVFSQKIILHRSVGGNLTYELNSVDSITFLPFVCGDDIIYEGKTYPTVLIGSQCWMKENLDVGTMIQGHINQANNSIIEKYCYNNDTANCTIYGGLYQWNEAMQYVTTAGMKGICPEGWHLPTLAEFQTLSSTVGGDGNALKAIGQGSGGGAGTNTSGFSALLAGHRNLSGYLTNLGYYATFWSSSEYDATSANRPYIYYSDSNINLNNPNKDFGFSVRCIKNQ